MYVTMTYHSFVSQEFISRPDWERRGMTHNLSSPLTTFK
jgi:hypothetical protein